MLVIHDLIRFATNHEDHLRLMRKKCAAYVKLYDAHQMVRGAPGIGDIRPSSDMVEAALNDVRMQVRYGDDQMQVVLDAANPTPKKRRAR